MFREPDSLILEEQGNRPVTPIQIPDDQAAALHAKAAAEGLTLEACWAGLRDSTNLDGKSDERVPSFIVDEVLARLGTLID